MPHKWQLGFQESASALMDATISFHNMMLIIIYLTMIQVCALVGYIIFRYNKKRNPIPSKVADIPILEASWVAWGVMLVAIMIFPSINLLRQEEYIPKPELTIKVVAHQWYWTYHFPDYDSYSFDSNIRYDIKLGEYRLLEVDNRLIVPVNTNIQIIITSSDVIHSWAVPSLGIKKDAIPGRLNETWMNINKPGVYYGQCSELCGILHGFMPIAIQAVTKDEFEKWINKVKQDV